MVVQRKTSTKKTRDLVQEIMVEQIAAGEDAGPTQIRQIIGERYGYTPSPNLVGEEIRNFWIKEGPEMVRKMQIPNIPDPVADAFRSVWEASLLAANEGLSKFKEEAKGDVLAAKGETAELMVRLAEAVSDQEAAEAALRDQTASHERILERANAAENKLAAAEALLFEAEKKLIALTSSASEQKNVFNEQFVAQQLAHSNEIDRLMSTHDAEIKRLSDISTRDAEAWEGVRRHLLVETDMQRESFKSELRALSGALDASRDIESALRRERSSFESQIAALKGQLEQRNADFIRMESRLAALLSSRAQKKRPNTYRPIK